MVFCISHQLLLTLGPILLIITESTISLELVEFHVPSHVPVGVRAHLSCRWTLGPADVLYSVKWYKDGREFFRHVPRDAEPRRKFVLPGVDVHASDSSGSNLTLAAVTLATAGRYRCEVSGEKPLFPTVSEHADLVVVVLPNEDPIITGFNPRYRTGARVRATCTSGFSQPATRLAWYLNGEPAPVTAVQTTRYENQDGLVRTHMEIQFVISEMFFRKNVLKVKCLATLSTIYWRSIEESALQEKVHDELEVRSRASKPARRADHVLFGAGRILTGSWGLNTVTLLWCSISVRYLLL